MCLVFAINLLLKFLEKPSHKNGYSTNMIRAEGVFFDVLRDDILIGKSFYKLLSAGNGICVRRFQVMQTLFGPLECEPQVESRFVTFLCIFVHRISIKSRLRNLVCLYIFFAAWCWIYGHFWSVANHPFQQGVEGILQKCRDRKMTQRSNLNFCSFIEFYWERKKIMRWDFE